MKGIRPGLCGWCKHRREEKTDDGVITCDAFPHGIPDFILVGEDHRKPIEGDNGIQFEEDPKNRLPDYIRKVYEE